MVDWHTEHQFRTASGNNKIRSFIFKLSVNFKQELEAVWQEQEMSECRGRNEQEGKDEKRG